MAVPAWSLERAGRVVLLTAGGLLALLLTAEILVAAQQPSLWRTFGWDFQSYLEAARRWVDGGSFYRPSDLAGPFEIRPGAILYPPSILPLLVPFLALPAVLWWLIPVGLTIATVIHHRPRLWARVGILACLSLGFLNAMVFWYGTPTIWFVATVALATRWPSAGALLLLKPTLAPLALIGIRRQAWWAVAAGVVALNLFLLPMFVDWLAVIGHAGGPRANPLYSVIDLPVLLIPILAWAGSPRRRWRAAGITARGRLDQGVRAVGLRAPASS